MKYVAQWTIMGILCVFGTHQAQAQHATGGHQMTSAAELKWAPSDALPAGSQIAVIQGPLNEAKPFIARLKFPANAKVPAHSHSAIEHVTVLSGVFNMGAGDKLDTSKTQPLDPGSVAVIQPGTNHFAWVDEETVVQIHGVGPWTVTYVNPADDPRKK